MQAEVSVDMQTEVMSMHPMSKNNGMQSAIGTPILIPEIRREAAPTGYRATTQPELIMSERAKKKHCHAADPRSFQPGREPSSLGQNTSAEQDVFQAKS